MSASVGRPICRKVEDLTTHLIPLIDQSKEIIFVDPILEQIVRII